ncbi:MAG: putative Zn finger-like uncharacterized protein [Ascidiaceihabitans sp.]|jgi:predicted Zn finger-like uncharacterized protein
MRLICPNCDAQYEVPVDVVPTEGRDVQCSNCGQTWFQHHPDHEPATEEDVQADTVDEAEERAEAPQEPQRREIDPAVADILRQEKEHETQLREQDAGGLESQPDLGLDDAEDESTRRVREARDRMARMRGEEPVIETAATAAAVGSRRDLLPDIEEINSTLRSTSDRQIAGDDASAMAPGRVRKKRGFRRGFILIVVIAIIMAVLYIFAPAIAKAIPQVDPYLSAYVGWIDQGRSWLDGHVQSMLKWLDDTAASQKNG